MKPPRLTLDEALRPIEATCGKCGGPASIYPKGLACPACSGPEVVGFFAFLLDVEREERGLAPLGPAGADHRPDQGLPTDVVQAAR